MRIRLALVAAMGLALASGLQGSLAKQPDFAGRAFMILLEQGPGGDRWRLYERVFPTESKALASDIARKLNNGASPKAAAAEMRERTDALVRNAAKFGQFASDDQLRAVALRQADLLDVLKQEDPKACAAFARLSGLGAINMLSPKAARAGEAMFVAQMEAIRGGRDHPVARDAGLRTEDFVQLNQLARALGAPQAGLDGALNGTLNAMSEEVRCDTGVGMMRAVATVQSDAGPRYVAAILGNAQGATARGEMTAAQAKALMETESDAGPAFKRFEQAYPDESQAMLENLARRTRAGGGGVAAVVEEVQVLLRSSHAMSRASDGALVAYARTQADVMDVFQMRDAEACGTMLTAGRPPSTTTADLNPAMTAGSVAVFDLLVAAKTAPSVHGPVSRGDLDYILSALVKAGMAPDKARATLELGVAALPNAERCAAQGALLRAVSTAPLPVAGRILAAMFDQPTI